MALTKEDLKAIGSLMDEKLDTRLSPIEQRLFVIENDLAEVKNDLAEVKNDLAGVKNDLAETKETVSKHYNMFEEFYVHQTEENTKIWNHFHIIHAQLELHSKQIEFNNARLSNRS